MTQKTIKNFGDETYSKPRKKTYAPNKIDVYHIDDIWSLDTSDIKGYGPEDNRFYRYVVAVIDEFSNLSWKNALKNRNAQTKKDAFGKILISPKRKQNYSKLIEERKFITVFSTVSKITITLNSTLKKHHQGLFIQDAVVVLLKIFL